APPPDTSPLGASGSTGRMLRECYCAMKFHLPKRNQCHATRHPAPNRSCAASRPRRSRMRVRALLVAAVVTIGVLGATCAQAAMSADQRIRVLEQALRRQQQEIQQLRQELHQQKAVGQATSKQAEQADQKATEVQAAQKAGPSAKWAD